MTMNTPLSKELSQRLKDVGFDVPTLQFYYDVNKEKLQRYKTVTDWNCAVNTISAPTLTEAIEWMDSKEVYEVPFLIFEELKPKGWGCRITFQNGKYWDDEFIQSIQPTRSSAYLAGLPPAITFLENKIKNNGK